MNKAILAIITAAAVSALKSSTGKSSIGSKSDLPETPEAELYKFYLSKIKKMLGRFEPSPTIYKHEIEFRIGKPNLNPDEVWGSYHTQMKGKFGNISESLEDNIEEYMSDYGYTDLEDEYNASQLLSLITKLMISGTALLFEFNIEESIADRGWLDTEAFLNRINNEDWTEWHLESVDHYFDYTQAYNIEQIIQFELRNDLEWQVEDYKSSNAIDNEDGTFEFMGDTFTEDEMDDIDENDILDYMVDEKIREYSFQCITPMEKKAFIDDYCSSALYPFYPENEYRDEEQFKNFLENRINHGLEGKGTLTIYSLNGGNFDFDTDYDDFKALLDFFVPERYYGSSRIFIYNPVTSVIKEELKPITVRRY